MTNPRPDKLVVIALYNRYRPFNRVRLAVQLSDSLLNGLTHNPNVMKPTIKRVSVVALLGVAILAGSQAHAQTLAKNTDWLEKQLNKLVKDDDQKGMSVNGKRATPKFTFNRCQMDMNLDTKDDDVSIGMNMAWQLKDVRKVSYKKEKDGQYALVLDVPADKMKMNMAGGGFSGSFNMNDKDSKKENSNTSFSLSTKDESLVKEIKQKFEESVQLCRSGKP